MSTAGLLTASDIRRVPTTGNVPAARHIKHEYQASEGEPFSTLRKQASKEAATYLQLRTRCSTLLRSVDGLRACRRNEQAQSVLCSAVREAIDAEDWRELWVLLTQIQRWLEIMDVPGANAVWPFWLQRSDEVRAGSSRGTALVINPAEEIELDDVDSAPAAVKEEATEEKAGQTASEQTAAQNKKRKEVVKHTAASSSWPSATQAAAVQEEPPARRRRTAAPPPLQLREFPVGCAVLTPRKEADGTPFVSYCKVLSHKEGQLQVHIPHEQPFLISLDYLRRTAEKHGKPMREEQAALAEAAATAAPATLLPPARVPPTAPKSVQPSPAPPPPPRESENARGKRKAPAVTQVAKEVEEDASGEVADDDVIFVGETAKSQLADFPHSRENCMLHAFATGKEDTRCGNCFCCKLTYANATTPSLAPTQMVGC